EAAQAYRAAHAAFAHAGQTQRLEGIETLIKAAEAMIGHFSGKGLPADEDAENDLTDDPPAQASRRFPSPLHRGSEIEALKSWAEDPTDPALCVLAGPVGRGKGTLLRQLKLWLDERRDSNGYEPHVVIAQVQRQEGTHAPQQWLRGLESDLVYL